MKRFLSCLFLTLFIVGKSFAYDFEANGIYYSITGSNTVEVSNPNYDGNYYGSITIPSTVTNGGNTYYVTAIGDSAFMNMYFDISQTYSISGITLPSSIVSIGNFAFWGCGGLNEITIPNSVTSIGNHAFDRCIALTDFVLPNNVTNIGYYALFNCIGLTQPVYNNTIFAFLPYSYGGAYTIPSGIQTIAGGAFAFCQNLTKVTIPASVTNIGINAFSSCSNLQNVTIPSGVTKIEYGTFNECTSLQNVSIPASVTEIGALAFCYCCSLTNILIPNGVPNIGENTFFGCSSLIDITIPSSVVSIGRDAFYSCGKLRSVTCQSVNPPTAAGAFSVNNFTTLYVPHGCYEVYKNAEMWSQFYPNIVCPVIISTYTEDYDKGTASGDSTYMSGSYAIICGWPNHGYRFDRWNDGNRNNPRILQVTQDSSFTAYFMPDTFRVHASSYNTAMGTVSGSGKYLYRDIATITATAAPGYEFKYWDNGETSSTLFVDVESDTFLVAMFAPAGTTDLENNDANAISIVSQGNRLIISGIIGKSIHVYDSAGRLIATRDDSNDLESIDVPVAGIYFVKIDEQEIMKVVVR